MRVITSLSQGEYLFAGSPTSTNTIANGRILGASYVLEVIQEVIKDSIVQFFEVSPRERHKLVGYIMPLLLHHQMMLSISK